MFFISSVLILFTSMLNGIIVTETETVLVTSSPCERLPEGAYGSVCEEGLKYWQEITPIASSAEFLNRITVDFVSSKDMPDNDGYATRNENNCQVKIRYGKRFYPELFTHEFGHCLGLTHDEYGEVNQPNYYGVMDYDTMTDASQLSDIRFLKASGFKVYNETTIKN